MDKRIKASMFVVVEETDATELRLTKKVLSVIGTAEIVRSVLYNSGIVSALYYTLEDLLAQLLADKAGK